MEKLIKQMMIELAYEYDSAEYCDTPIEEVADLVYNRYTILLEQEKN